MTFDHFIFAVKEKVEEGVEDQVIVSLYETVKNNRTVRKGLAFTRKDINVSPTIFLEEYYRQYCGGISIEEITEDILQLYGQVKFQHVWDSDFVKDFEQIMDKIVYRLISREANKELLDGIPNYDYLDLSIVFYVLVDITEYGTASMLIRYEHLDMWEVSPEEIYRNAKYNSPILLKAVFRELQSVIEDITGVQEEKDRNQIYVLTNHIKSNGAAAVLYEGCLEQIGAVLGENYYVLPSSIHEVIIVPESVGAKKGELACMVKEINETQVEPEEVLSDNVYYYNREKQELEL